ncbi:hypothetical protein AB0395_45510 [Streptosporangium sp. NPDC051023]|uniref:hypothetical protein n=1 Tax=Streptosporangium sp. NPDC051023 TaxID=3155410 RepID=UPI00344EBA75
MRAIHVVKAWLSGPAAMAMLTPCRISVHSTTGGSPRSRATFSVRAVNERTFGKELTVRIKAIAVGTAVALGLALNGLTANPASAASAGGYTYSCSRGGFTGYIYVNFSRGSNGRIYRINWLQYRINKGRNRGGNSANVFWYDPSTLPATSVKTTHGIQDNRWHRFSGSLGTGGGRGSTFKFIFDKSSASDPSCWAPTHMR